ncbi:long tail fiber protein distal subunit [Ochrobactrum phage vB_OspP_OH]|uniref:Baseplate protein n=1 Tax=Ochrobactrum phage vB_OspP_OH TaxID=2712957 RepID=A0A6G6XXS1_9CAUD|nr:long tail fiber protein distal subunit [Ochrobactrum phage vB_OspP_OH]QIG66101.1 baseplate protein [Ochrobactrum phage vB_OspP_OH]
MADTQTSNYQLTKPEVGGSPDTWGDKTNNNWDKVDTLIKKNDASLDSVALRTTYHADDWIGIYDSQTAGFPIGRIKLSSILGDIPNIYAKKAGDTFTGTVDVRSAADTGFIRLGSGTTTLAGGLSIYNPDGTRKFYMGGDTKAGPINFLAENGASRFHFSGAEVVSKDQANSFRMVYGGASAFWRNDGNTMYLMFSDTEFGSYNTLRPFAANRATGRVTIGNGLTVVGDISGTSSWANGANYADRLGYGGWTLATVQDQLNWRVTDTRVDGYFQNECRTTGSTGTVNTGGSGYFVTVISKRAGVEVLDIALRQPQRYIPNQGWRAIGGW